MWFRLDNMVWVAVFQRTLLLASFGRRSEDGGNLFLHNFQLQIDKIFRDINDWLKNPI